MFLRKAFVLLCFAIKITLKNLRIKESRVFFVVSSALSLYIQR
jgi:hypothetical protein